MFEGITLTDFLNHDNSAIGNSDDVNGLFEAYELQLIGGTELVDADDYRFLLLDGGNTAVWKDDRCVGFFFDDNLAVTQNERGKNLGPALVLYAYENNYTREDNRKFSKCGLIAFVEAYYVGRGLWRNKWWQ